MTPRKNRPVLYEVIARSRGAREPIWKRWTSAGRDRTASPARSVPPVAPPAAGPPSSETSATAETGAAQAREAVRTEEALSRGAAEPREGEAVPALQMDKDGVVLTLSWAGVATVLVTLALALAFAYQAGSLTGGSKAGATAAGAAPNGPGAATPSGGLKPGESAKSGDSSKSGAPQKPPVKPEAAKSDVGKPLPVGAPPGASPLNAEHRPADVGARQAPGTKEEPKTSKEEPKSAPAPEGDENAAAKVEFKPGYEYLIVQHFTRAQKDAAEAAEAFLKSNGIDCVLLRGRELTLVCTESFLLKQKDAAARSAAEKQRTQLKNRVRQLGTDFAKTYGFAFDQCYTRVMKQP